MFGAGAGEGWREEAGVMTEADSPGGHGERGGDEELEEEEEGEPAAEAAGVDTAEEVEGASGGGESGAEFGPDQTVT